MTTQLRIVHNRPGLAAIAYRIATHGRFKHNLVDRLASEPALRALTTRSDDDFAIALLDAWACAADILTFYQERLANESWLRTATERLSLGHIAALLGYQPGPGVAASAPVVFTVDAFSSKNLPVPLAPGLKLQSIPAPGEQPQTFELGAPATVRADHNELRAATEATAPRPSYTLRLTGDPADFAHPLLVLDIDDDSDGAPALRIVRDHTLTRSGTQLAISWSGPGREPAPASDVAILAHRVPVLRVDPADQNNLIAITVAPLPGVDLTSRTPFVLTDGRDEEPYVALTHDLVQDGIQLLVRLAPGQRSPARFAGGAALLPSDVRTQIPPAETRMLVSGTVRAGDVLLALTADHRWRVAQIAAATPRSFGTEILVPRWTATTRTPPPGPEDLFVLRGRAALFGHNAPEAALLRETAGALVTTADNVSEWTNFALADADPLDLDTTYDGLQRGDPIVVRAGTTALFATIAGVDTRSRAAYALNARVSRVSLQDADGEPLSSFDRRTAEVLFARDPITQIGPPRTDPVAGATLDLQGPVRDLVAGQTLFLSGPDALTGDPVRELATVASAQLGATTTTVLLREPLAHTYRRDALVVRANVAFASHGETVAQTLGSGDAAVPLQRFTLQQGPLTFLPAATARGRVSTLRVTVDGDLWREVDSFEGMGPRDRVYTVTLTDQGGAVVQFGDGLRGARLPSGEANVRAVYRRGLGLSGQVGEGQLALLATPTLGITAVSNPLPAAGAAPPEDLADVRRNAPLPVRTLGRVVALRDYEDFARAFTGVAKAHAVAFKDRAHPGVLVTVAGTDGAPPGAQTAVNLLAALRAAGDPFVTVRLHSHDPAAKPRPTFTFAASIQVAPDRDPDALRADLRAALVARFGFAAAEFARPIFRSAVVTAIQSVPGVVAVDLTDFARTDDVPDATTVRLLARVATSPADRPTEILTLDPAALARLHLLPVKR